MEQQGAGNGPDSGPLALRRAVTDVIGYDDLHRQMLSQHSYAKAVQYQAMAAAGCLRLAGLAESLLPTMQDAAPGQTEILERMRACIGMLASSEACLALDEVAEDGGDLMAEQDRALHSEALLSHGTNLARLVLAFRATMGNEDE